MNNNELRQRLSNLLIKYEEYESGTVQNVLHDLIVILKDWAESEPYEE